MTCIKLPDAKFVEDSKGRLWLPISEITSKGVEDIKGAELIQLGADTFYEVMGYSIKRKAYWVQSIDIDGAAAHIEDEVYDSV